MATNYKLVKPTSPKPDHGSRFVITRGNARKIIDWCDSQDDMIRELCATQLRNVLTNALRDGEHDTHISFYINEQDVDLYTCYEHACMALFNTYQEVF